MPETERFAVPLQKSFRPTVANIEETLNNAVAAYAVKHRLLIEEVAAYFQGFAVGAKECVAVYLVCQLPMSATERASIRKCAAEKARKAAACSAQAPSLWTAAAAPCASPCV